MLRRKGYAGPAAVIPQFGVDPELYRPLEREGREAPSRRPFTIGYLGRLVEEKGLLVLLRALAQLAGEWRLEVTGQRSRWSRAWRPWPHELGIASRVALQPGVPSAGCRQLLNGWTVSRCPR